MKPRQEITGSENGKVWSFGAFRFSTSPYRLMKGSTQVPLRPQPARLLELLLSNAGKPVPRDKIRNSLWAQDTFVDFEQGINFVVRELRRALGDHASDPTFIETIPTAGYRFVCATQEIGPATAAVLGPDRVGRRLLAAAAIALVMVTGLFWADQLSSRAAADSLMPDSDLTGWWVGTSNLYGERAFLQLRFEEAGSTIEAFGVAPLSFDGRFASADVQVRTEDGVHDLEWAHRDEPVNMRAEVLGGVLRATTPDGQHTMSAVRMAKFWPGPLVGTYRGEGRSVGVTAREFNGLRAIDLDSGQSESLFPLTERRFVTLQQVRDFDLEEPAYRFPSRDTKTVGLVIGDWREPLTLHPDRSVVQEPLRFSAPDGTDLAGTVVRPSEGDSLPGIVIVHGSGPIYRSALFQRAHFYASNGFATLVFDKRGTGESKGTYQGDAFDTLAGDARAAVDALRRLEEVDPLQVGLQGHSQAGFIIPLVANLDPSLAFAIIANGGGVGTVEQSLFDKGNDLRRLGFSDAERASALRLMARFFDYFRDRIGDRAALEVDYLAAKAEPWFEVTDLPNVPGIPAWDAPPPEMLRFSKELQFDPVEAQRNMTMPVLVLLAESDETVPPARAAEGWRATSSVTGNQDIEIVSIPDANHGMRLVEKDGSTIISPDYLSAQLRWLRRFE